MNPEYHEILYEPTNPDLFIDRIGMIEERVKLFTEVVNCVDMVAFQGLDGLRSLSWPPFCQLVLTVLQLIHPVKGGFIWQSSR